MYVVTGGAGFVGSNLVGALNRRGITDILVVDNLETNSAKFRNLVGRAIADYVDKRDFLGLLDTGRLGKLTAVLHQGACSDTMELDGRYMMENNYAYSKAVFDYCQGARVPLLYASSAAVYGASQEFAERPENEQPLNVYGYSKLLFDNYLRRHAGRLQAPVTGFRYFNVYGPGEAHKGRMASVARQFFLQYREEGCVRLFSGSGGYGDGEQRRDFVAVDDLTRAVLHFLDRPQGSGVFNLGSGEAASFNRVAQAVINACRDAAGEAPLDLPALVASGAVRYVDFPPGLAERYQSYTQADLAGLRLAGYDGEFMPVERGVADYVRSLLADS
ncbi:ADP-glyceromanno-heptose 6-epimerase [Immundisolibacter sp.]|uniref:ADP-glyceromanno-heptose 6-epimerase n=1 Tax=Immundisolibacter sp. TaxID=1934948 RepID=UPI00356A3050